MKTKSLFILIMILYSPNFYSQIIKLNNGILISKTTNIKKNILNKSTITYMSALGIEYFEQKYYYLSSELSYIKLGAKGNDTYIEAQHVPVHETWNCIQLNTTIRAKYPLKKTHIYVGIGPKLDFILGDQKFKSSFLKDLPGLNRADIGAKVEGGIVHDFYKMRVGINYSYNFNFMNIGSRLYNYNHCISLSIGYRLI